MGTDDELGWRLPIFALAVPNSLFHRGSSGSKLSRSKTSVASFACSGSGLGSGSYLPFPPIRMGAMTGGSADESAAFPLRLSLALALPLRLEEAKDNVPCLRPSEVFGRWALEPDLCGAMIVVV